MNGEKELEGGGRGLF